jgi:hypothetical protein
MKVLMAFQNHPDKCHPYWRTFIERSINSIVKNGIEIEAIIPRSWGFLYSDFSKLTLKGETGNFTKYYPRYFYQEDFLRYFNKFVFCKKCNQNI